MQSICGGKQLQQLREIVKALTTDGEIWECGVYRGGSAKLLHEIIGNRTLRIIHVGSHAGIRRAGFHQGLPGIVEQLDQVLFSPLNNYTYGRLCLTM